MEMTASSFKLRANAPEGRKAISYPKRFPLRWRVIEDEVRRGLLRRFPCAFYYWVKIPGEELEVLSIGHSKRQPLYWKSRRE
jgi:hypothetical protein